MPLEGAGIRSILYDHDLYAATVTVDDSAESTEIVDGIVAYSASTKVLVLRHSTRRFLCSQRFFSRVISSDHRSGRIRRSLLRRWAFRAIVTVEVMEGEPDLIGIIVNLKDYTIGTDKGGEINFFDDFDIDYNQYKYLSGDASLGCLTKIRSALVVKKARYWCYAWLLLEARLRWYDGRREDHAGRRVQEQGHGVPMTTASPVTVG